jgi:hypothetical protein
MKALAKRTVQAASQVEAIKIALASIHGADKHLVDVQCMPNGPTNYTCTAGYKSRKQLRKEGIAAQQAHGEREQAHSTHARRETPMTQYTKTLDVLETVNGQPVSLVIDGVYAQCEYVVGADYLLANGHRYIEVSDARRKQSAHLRFICAIYRTNSNQFYVMDASDVLRHAGTQQDAIAMAQQLADTQETPMNQPTISENNADARAKAQHQLDHADELEIPELGRQAYREILERTPAPDAPAPTTNTLMWSEDPTGPCAYCGETTYYECEQCSRPMCSDCVPGNVCPYCHPELVTPEDTVACPSCYRWPMSQCLCCKGTKRVPLAWANDADLDPQTDDILPRYTGRFYAPTRDAYVDIRPTADGRYIVHTERDDRDCPPISLDELQGYIDSASYIRATLPRYVSPAGQTLAQLSETPQLLMLDWLCEETAAALIAEYDALPSAHGSTPIYDYAWGQRRAEAYARQCAADLTARLEAEDARSPKPARRSRVKHVAAIAGAALFLALSLSPAGATDAPAPPPANCAVVGTVRGDEGFPLALCADGTYLYQDMDGGLYAPGTWRDASGYVS